MKGNIRICFLAALILFAWGGVADAQTPPHPAEVLEKSCAIYSENWQGLRYHYPNGKPFMDLLMERATLEPQSTLTSSLEIAARTLTETLSEKPYPDFSETLNLVFEDGMALTLEATDLEALWEVNPYALSSNSYPSFWGDAGVSEKNDYCIHKRAITKLINFHGKKWLWWHPRSLNFKLEEVEEIYSCWEAGVGQAAGVVLDLRDTSGGSFKQIYLMAHQFFHSIPAKMRTLVSDGQLSREIMEGAKSVLISKTEAGDLRELEIKTPEAAKKITPWKGPLVLITNGLCGSACDIIAYHLQQRENTCTYGTPNGGQADCL